MDSALIGIRFHLQEINLYPYLTWVFYGLLLFLSPFWVKIERRLFTFFLVTLIFETAFTINLGGFFVRPSYIVGLVLVVRTFAHGITFPGRYAIPLALFVLAAITGIFLNLDLIGIGEIISLNPHATFLRPMLQLGQIIIMIFIAVSVFTILKRKHYFKHTIRVLHWLSVIVAISALYEIIAIYFHLPYLNLNNMLPEYWYPRFGVAGIPIFRPRVTFIEPITLNSFQFLGIASSLAYKILYNKQGWRYWGLLAIQLVVLLGSFSRSTMVTVAALAPIFILFYPRQVRSAIGFLFDKAFRFLFVAIAIIIIMRVFVLTPEKITQINLVERVLYSRLVASRAHKTLGFSSLGRANALSEVSPLADQGKLGFGVGLGNDANWRGTGGTSNLYNQILIYSGLIGLSVFFIFICSILYGLFRNYLNRLNGIDFRRVCWIFFIGFLAMLIQRLSFSGLLTDTYLWVAFALCIYLGQKKSAMLS